MGVLSFTPWELAFFAGATAAARLLRRKDRLGPGTVGVGPKIVGGCLLLLSAACFIFGTQSFRDDAFSLYSMWHHWSAYIGPAELLKTGGRILYDFPAQYGFGPTLLLAYGADTPWLAMYLYCCLGTLVCLGMVVWMSQALCAGRSFAHRLIVLAVSCSVCLLWVAAPYYLVTPLSAPSTFALRFFPVLALVFYLFQTESRPSPADARRPWAPVLWALGSLWSPESAFYATFVW